MENLFSSLDKRCALKKIFSVSGTARLHLTSMPMKRPVKIKLNLLKYSWQNLPMMLKHKLSKIIFPSSEISYQL
jgi:hypothetical protein